MGEKVIVTYGDGQCYSHVLGGAGDEGYLDTDTWGMAEMGKTAN